MNDLGDVVKFLIVILIVVVPVVSQILAKLRNQKPPPAGAPQPPRPRQEDFKQEIEDFLRRAVEGREAKRPGPARTAQQPRRKPSAPPPGPQPAKPARPEEPAPVGGSVVEHVKKYLDTSDFSRRTAQLGEEVALADDKVDARLHDVFEHQLGQFDWRTPSEVEAAGGQPAATAAGAAGIALLLANPENLRQAIVLNEILQRPAQRWA